MTKRPDERTREGGHHRAVRGPSRWEAALVAGLLSAAAVVLLWPGVIRPWSESAVPAGPGLTVRLVHPSLWTIIVAGRASIRGGDRWAWQAADRLEVIDNATRERVVAMRRPRYDTIEDGVTGLTVLWHPDGHRVVCVYHHVGFGGAAAAQCFYVHQQPLVIREFERGVWVLEAIPKELPGGR